MRFGLTLSYPDLGNDPGFLKHLAQATEEAGFDHLLGAEHVIGGHPDRLRDEKVHTYDVPYHEPFVLFGFLGAVTSRIELVTGILILPQRQTALVAKQAAELDLLTGGRLRLGVGVGRNWMEYEALNEDFSNRGARIEEQVEVLRRLWTEELVTFDGDWHHLDRMGLNPMPVRRPIPIWMGSYRGRVVDKVIRRIARLADGWFPQLPPGRRADRGGGPVARLRGRGRPGPSHHRHRSAATSLRRDDDAQRWIDEADAFRALGATHLRLVTAFAGLRDARAAPGRRAALAGGGAPLRRPRGAEPYSPTALRAVDDVTAQRLHGRQGIETDGDHAEADGVALGRERGRWRGCPAPRRGARHAATTVAQRAVERLAGMVEGRRKPVGEREVGRPDVHGVDAGHRQDVVDRLDGAGGSRSSGCTPRPRSPRRHRWCRNELPRRAARSCARPPARSGTRRRRRPPPRGC